MKMRPFSCCLLLAATSGCGTVTFQQSAVTGSAYLFGVDYTGTNGLAGRDGNRGTNRVTTPEWTNVVPGRLWNPYKVGMDGTNILTGDVYQVTLNRVWLRHLQSLEGNVLVYADVFEGEHATTSERPSATNETNSLQRGSTNAHMFAFEGVQQGSFLPLADLVLCRTTNNSAQPVRLRIRVMVLRTEKEKDLFDLVANLVGGFNASPLTPRQVEMLGGLLAKLKPDSIELSYDATFSHSRPGRTNSPIVLPFREAQYAVIKGESGYRDVAFGSYLVHYGVPFNWLGATVAPGGQKREVGNENDDVELFQYTRYRRDPLYLLPLSCVAETTWSVVRLPFYLVYWTFKRPWTRNTGAAIESLVWEGGELRNAEADGKWPSERLYTEKSYMVFSLSAVE